MLVLAVKKKYANDIENKAHGCDDDDDDDDDFEAVLHPGGPLSNANFLLRGGSNLLKEKW